MLTGGFGGFIAPHSPHLLNVGQMMPLLSMAHSVRRFARKFVQPLMYLGVRLAKSMLRLRAMLFKGRHFLISLPYSKRSMRLVPLENARSKLPLTLM
jgi:hypothetical protein